MSRRIKLSAILLALILLGLAELGLYKITRGSMLGVPVAFDSGSSLWRMDPYSEALPDDYRRMVFGVWPEGTLEQLRTEIPAEITKLPSEREQYLALATWARSNATAIGTGIVSDDPLDILDEMQAGQAASCGEFARLYRAAAHSLGLPARRVQLMRNPPFNSYDTHVVVEVFVDGRWVVVDPTFNTYYLIGDRWASAADLQRNLAAPKVKKKPVETVYIAGRRFPGTIVEEYYIDPLLLYNHISLRVPAPSRKNLLEKAIGKIPPTRYLFGLGLSRIVHEDPRISPSRFANYFALTAYLVLPSVIVLLILYLWSLLMCGHGLLFKPQSGRSR